MYKATIVIPNINGKGWLKDSIESVYAQTEQNFRLIVVDNGSTTKVWSRPAAIAAAKISPSSKTAPIPDFPMQ